MEFLVKMWQKLCGVLPIHSVRLSRSKKKKNPSEKPHRYHYYVLPNSQIMVMGQPNVTLQCQKLARKCSIFRIYPLHVFSVGNGTSLSATTALFSTPTFYILRHSWGIQYWQCHFSCGFYVVVKIIAPNFLRQSGELVSIEGQLKQLYTV